MEFITLHDTYNADSQNLNIFIECERRGIFVESLIPQDISFKTSAKWESFFGNLDNNGIISTVDSAVQLFSGYSIQNPILKRKIWKGSEPMSFSLPLIFFSMTDAKNEVFQPAQDLLNLCLPRQLATNKLVFEVPGPVPVSGTSGKGLPVNVYIGQWLALKSVYIQDVEVRFSSATQNSYPTRADVTVTIGMLDASTSGNVFMQEPIPFSISDLSGLLNTFNVGG